MPPEILETPPFPGIPSSLLSRGPGKPSPGGRLYTPAAHQVLLRRPFFRRWQLGLLYGADVVRPRGRGGQVALGRAGRSISADMRWISTFPTATLGCELGTTARDVNKIV